MTGYPLLSVIVPCFNEIAILDVSHNRLVRALEQGPPIDFEIVYVDDGSTDATFAMLEGLARADRRICVVQFTRNFGHQPAIMAGLAHCRGAYVAVLDSDMQDPPELLGAMLQLLQDSSSDVVYGLRRRREGEFWAKQLAAKVYYRLLMVASDVAVPADAGDFRLMRRSVVDALVALPEKRKYVRGMTVWLGYTHTAFPYVREARMGGTTKYSLGKLMELAGYGFTSLGSRALVLPWILAALFVPFIAVLWGSALWEGHAMRAAVAWAILGTGVLLILVSFGIVGLFIRRVLVEVQARPMYVIRTRINLP